jgi:hypothetical protein
MKQLIPTERIQQQIYMIRGHRVMRDADLAKLYGVPTKVLLQSVKRNRARFPEDFMFQLSPQELQNWRSQFVTSNLADKMGLRRSPFVFTEPGVAMLSSVLRSARAIQVNIAIVRAFIQLRHIISLHRDLARRISAQEKKMEGLTDYVQKMFDLIHPLLDGPTTPIKEIGFHTKP